MYHFDHPQILEDQFGGWQSPKMVDKYAEYAKFIFDEYGAKVGSRGIRGIPPLLHPSPAVFLPPRLLHGFPGAHVRDDQRAQHVLRVLHGAVRCRGLRHVGRRRPLPVHAQQRPGAPGGVQDLPRGTIHGRR